MRTRLRVIVSVDLELRLYNVLQMFLSFSRRHPIPPLFFSHSLLSYVSRLLVAPLKIVVQCRRTAGGMVKGNAMVISPLRNSFCFLRSRGDFKPRALVAISLPARWAAHYFAMFCNKVRLTLTSDNGDTQTHRDRLCILIGSLNIIISKREQQRVRSYPYLIVYLTERMKKKGRSHPASAFSFTMFPLYHLLMLRVTEKGTYQYTSVLHSRLPPHRHRQFNSTSLCDNELGAARERDKRG